MLLGIVVEDDVSIQGFSRQFLKNDFIPLPWQSILDAMNDVSLEFMLHMVDICVSVNKRFRLFRIENGLVGCGPQNLECTDIIYLVRDVFCLLRLGELIPYELIGSCFILGLVGKEQDRTLRENTCWQEIKLY